MDYISRYMVNAWLMLDFLSKQDLITNKEINAENQIATLVQSMKHIIKDEFKKD
jgi:hypothetical protein